MFSLIAAEDLSPRCGCADRRQKRIERAWGLDKQDQRPPRLLLAMRAPIEPDGDSPPGRRIDEISRRWQDC